MPDPVKADPQEDKVHSVRWRVEQWQRLEQAAALLGEREVLNVSVSDIIRSGAMRRADEILGEVAA